MKPYGVDRSDHGCCPGHDKFPSYNSNRSKRAHAKAARAAHKRARARARQAELEAIDDAIGPRSSGRVHATIARLARMGVG